MDELKQINWTLEIEDEQTNEIEIFCSDENDFEIISLWLDRIIAHIYSLLPTENCTHSIQLVKNGVIQDTIGTNKPEIFKRLIFNHFNKQNES